MAIPIKTPGETAQMRSSGRLAWRAVSDVVAACRVGATSRELDQAARDAIARVGGKPLLLGYEAAERPGFPGAACICINEEVVHAIPSDRIMRDGDVVTIDLALESGGWCADVARTVALGGDRGRKLAGLAMEALEIATRAVRPGVLWSAVAAAARQVAEQKGCGLVTGYSGHGIGRRMHEEPRLCFGQMPGAGDVRLRPGMVVTLEPIVVEGAVGELVTLDDGWTVVNSNRAWAAHEERVVAVTRGGCEVLTGE